MICALRQALEPPPVDRLARFMALLETPGASVDALLPRSAERLRRHLNLPGSGGRRKTQREHHFDRVPGAPSLWDLPLLLDAARAVDARTVARRRRLHAAHATPPAVAMALGRQAARFGHVEGGVLDPACGGGALLLGHLMAIEDDREAAWTACLQALHARDIDPLAVETTRLLLHLLHEALDAPTDTLHHRIRREDALALRKTAALPTVELLLMNPPWVSYAGRAANRLTDTVRKRMRTRFATFAGYPCLQGPFLESVLPLLRPGGRLAAILPSSMTEARGYQAFRTWVDRELERDDELPLLPQDSFHGVNQPSFFLLGARRATPAAPQASASPGTGWRTRSTDPSESTAREVLDRIRPQLCLDAFATWMDAGLRSRSEPLASGVPTAGCIAVLRGRDVLPGTLLPASRQVDTRHVPDGFLRDDARWRRATVLIRQTGAWTVAAAVTKPVPFLNSILAAVPHKGWPPEAIAAWLNTLPVRWLHHWQHLDARQGIPQVKLRHLAMVPTPPLALRDHQPTPEAPWFAVAEALAWERLVPDPESRKVILAWGRAAGAVEASAPERSSA